MSNNEKIEIDKNTNKDCFEGFSKILVIFLIPIFIGYIILEIEKIDTIRTKKMESFEIIIDSFNEISKKAFSNNAISGLNYVYNTLLLGIDNTDKFNENSELNRSIIDVKLAKLKIDLTLNMKQLEVDNEVLFTKISYHENLLKSYYGYSKNENILPISKMLWIIEYNNNEKKKFNQSLFNIVEEIKPLLFKQLTINNIEDAKKIEKIMKEKIDNWILEQDRAFKITQKLNVLYSKESAKLYNDIYNIYFEELNTPIFKLYTDKNREKFSKIVYSPKNKIIKLKIFENENNEFYFEE